MELWLSAAILGMALQPGSLEELRVSLEARGPTLSAGDFHAELRVVASRRLEEQEKALPLGAGRSTVFRVQRGEEWSITCAGRSVWCPTLTVTVSSPVVPVTLPVFPVTIASAQLRVARGHELPATLKVQGRVLTRLAQDPRLTFTVNSQILRGRL